MVLKLSGNPEQQLALRRFDKPAQLQKSLSDRQAYENRSEPPN